MSKFLALTVLVGLIGAYPLAIFADVAGSVAGNQDQIPSYTKKSATRVELLKLVITQGNPVDLHTLDQIKVTMLADYATVVDAGGVLLIRDDGGTPGKIDGTDTQVANASISGGVATINLGDPLRSAINGIAAGETLTYFIAVNIAATAADASTVDARIDTGNITFNMDTTPLTFPSGAAFGGGQYITIDD
ncbi:MAG: hypothetical protein WC926_05335, partial [Candidatus Paceibacterota bacterium]